jgi:hypothetical protein
VLVGLLDYPVTGGPVEVPHHLDPPGCVRDIGEHDPELDRDLARTLKCHFDGSSG